MKATGYVARVTMDDWTEKFRQKLDKLGIKVHMLTKYVDDVLIWVDNVRPGSRIIEDRIEYRHE